MSGSWSKRLADWSEIVATEAVDEDPEVLGGREAERFLNTLVESHFNFEGASLYPNKRVPAGYRRREIDLIVVTSKKIHVIEVKNWSGTLRDEGGLWVQTNRAGRRIEHPDLVADIVEKDSALIEYLNRQGVALEPRLRDKYMVNKVLFMNPKLGILSGSIARNPDVLVYGRLAGYLDQQRRAGFGE